jgi:outer membrane assembly lipoprotein YfiO
VIKTRKRIILPALSFIITACLASSSLSISCNDSNTTTQQQFDVALPVIENSSHNKRMRKPRNKQKKEKKTKRGRTYQDFEYEELTRAKNVQVTKGNNSVAIKYLEQMMKLCNNMALLADHLLEISDLFFADGQFQKASHLYARYCELYPGSEKQEYALYRSITSSFACILSVDRDQTKTEETLALTEEFLQQDHFTAYKNEVTAIQTQCYEQLAASECNICNFYLTRGKLAAAEKRLKRIRSTWLPKLPTLEPNIITLETQLSEKKEEFTLLNVKHTKLAHNKRPKHMADRF